MINANAHINESNKTWGDVPTEPNRFQAFKMKQNTRGQSVGINPMQKAKEKKKTLKVYLQLINITTKNGRTT